MRSLRGVLIVAFVHALAACGGSASPTAPPASTPVLPAAPVQLKGNVIDTANRALAGASVDVLSGPQAGTSTTSDAVGAFSLTGAFDGATRFRASKEGHAASTRSFNMIGAPSTISFVLAELATPANIAGDYTATFVADSVCASQLPASVRTRTYSASITTDSSSSRPLDTVFVAVLSGASLDTYYRRIQFFVAGDYVSYDLSDNYVLEEVAEETYLALGGRGGSAFAGTGASPISASFDGTFDYCEMTSELENSGGYSCVPGNAVVHAQCQSRNHRLILTRR